ncbi:hypothetical protein [Persicobacter sp. CCB-QB2]|uniref:hypothetical protein n=1 Tax=Persicobacter sp. CCB-QB2 TaxID=1561025 RepID=UPI0006A9C237|nr:hypothetical protein [Persicobacter sp. CCB-QB2]
MKDKTIHCCKSILVCLGLIVAFASFNNCYAQYYGNRGYGYGGGYGTRGIPQAGADHQPKEPTKEELAEKATEEMKKDLKLSFEQELNVNVVNHDHYTKAFALREKAMSGQGDQQDLADQFRALQEDYKKKMEGILTEKQFEQWKNGGKKKKKKKKKDKKKSKDTEASKED